MSNNQFGDNDDDALLAYDGGTTTTTTVTQAPNYSETPTSYNFGPRKATDIYWAVAFLGLVSAQIIWSLVGVSYGTGEAGKAGEKVDYVLVWQTGEISYNNGECVWSDTTTPLLLAEDNAKKQSAAAVIATPLALAIVGAFILGAFKVIAFRFIPKIMVYTVVAIKILTPAAAGILYLTMASGDSDCFGYTTTPPQVRGLNMSAVEGDYDDDGNYDACANPTRLPAYALFGASALVALYYYWQRKTLALIVKLFKESSTSIQDNWTLIPVNAFIVFSGFLIWLLMMAGMVFYVLHFQVVPSVDGQTCEPRMVGAAKAMIGFTIVMAGWWLSWTTVTKTYIVADSVGCWYWHGKANSGSNVLRATKHAFLRHLGANAFAALLMEIITYLKKKAKARFSFINPFQCFIRLCILCILKRIEYLCKLSTITCAITGQSFLGAGSTVVRLFTASFGNMELAEGMSNIPAKILSFFCLLLALVWGALTGLVTYYAVNKSGPVTITVRETSSMGSPSVGLIGPRTRECANYYGAFSMDQWTCTGYNSDGAHDISPQCEEAIWQDYDSSCTTASYGIAIGLGLGAFVIVWYLLKFFSSIILAIVDTIFMCYIIDMDKGVVTKPELHEVMSDMLRSKKAQFITTVAVNGGGGNTTVVTQGHGGATVVVQQQPPMVQHQQQQMMAPPPQYAQQPAPAQYAQQPAPVQQQASFCKNCGHPAPSGGSKFCNSCGNAL